MLQFSQNMIAVLHHIASAQLIKLSSDCILLMSLLISVFIKPASVYHVAHLKTHYTLMKKYFTTSIDARMLSYSLYHYSNAHKSKYRLGWKKIIRIVGMVIYRVPDNHSRMVTLNRWEELILFAIMWRLNFDWTTLMREETRGTTSTTSKRSFNCTMPRAGQYIPLHQLWSTVRNVT